MSQLKKFLFILSAFSVLYVINTTKQEEEKRIMDKILDNKTYDTSIRPLGDNSTDEDDKPCIVTTNVFIKSISDIDDHKMEYSMQVTFRQNWKDNRLVYKSMLNTNESKTKIPIKYVSLRDISKIWTPDLFFSNEKESHFHDIMTPNNLVRIFPDGSIAHSTRISLTLACPMNLKYFPFDKQVCNIRMASYSYTTDDIVFRWVDKGPIQLVKDLYLPRFNFSRWAVSDFNISTKTGKYSGLQLTLDFKREYGYYIIQFYVPCALLVIISWLSFWLDEIPTDARLSLVVTNLITLALLIVAINSTLPTVSYVKAIDVYTGICLLFVIATVFQYTIATLAAFEEERNRQQQEKEEESRPIPAIETEKKSSIPDDNDSMTIRFRGKMESENKTLSNLKMAGAWTKFRKWRHRMLPPDMPRSKRIDNSSKFIFPFLFTVFVILYWVFLPGDI